MLSSLSSSRSETTQPLTQKLKVSSSFELLDDIDHEIFFERLSSLDVRSDVELSAFLSDYKFRRLRIRGMSEQLIIIDRSEPSLFDDSTVELWKKYYINEAVVQIAILQDELPFPLEGLFVGVDTGNVYICQEADDYSEQKIKCIADSLEKFVEFGPQKLLEYKSPKCLFDNCYGCFDPFIRDRVMTTFGLGYK